MDEKQELEKKATYKNDEKNHLSNRKEAIDKIINGITITINDTITLYNEDIYKVNNFLSEGIKGGKATLIDDLVEQRELYDYEGGDLDKCKENLTNESNNCASRISELESDIKNIAIEIVKKDFGI